jgi:ribosomal protein L28
MQSLRTCLNAFTKASSTLTTTTGARSFSTTPSVLAKSSRHRLETMLADVPPYPYEIKSTFKQHWFGLYGGRHIIYGNQVSHKDEKKHRRSWKPNLKHTSLYSETLGRLKVKVCVGVLRMSTLFFFLSSFLNSSSNYSAITPRWAVVNKDI